MANTSTTATVIDHSSDAAFRTWVAEIITQLTGNGLVQTSDTGQINTSTATRPGGTQASGGYAIFRFSDTLQSTFPVFFRLDFGNATTTTNPQMWITVGTSTNGAGTITGQKTLTQACFYNGPLNSTVTSYTSRFVVNMTLGYVGIAYKLGGSSGTTACTGGFQLFRTNDSTGAPSSDGIVLMSNGVPGTATFPTSMPAGTTSSMGYQQCLGFGTGTVYPNSSPSNGNLWPFSGSGGIPMSESSTSSGGNFTLFPVPYRTPAFSFSAFNGYGLLAEMPIGTTFSTAMVGTTSLTFISIGQPWGSTYMGTNSTSTVGWAMLWQ